MKFKLVQIKDQVLSKGEVTTKGLINNFLLQKPESSDLNESFLT
jgi:hypothetical protein